MKAAAFDYLRPADTGEALTALAAAAGAAKPVSGGQSLGPMLNLRLAQPGLLVDLAGLQALRRVDDDGAQVFLGARTTHAEIEDGRVPDPSRGLMPRVAADIAYRAVRNRGTLGGSLAHADPAADWVSTMRLLDARCVIARGDVGTAGASERVLPIGEFLIAPFTTALGESDLLLGVSITRLSADAQWAWWKFCRKPGEFAEAIAGIVHDPARGTERVVLGALDGMPACIEGPGTLDRLAAPGGVDALLAEAGLDVAGDGGDGDEGDPDAVWRTRLRRTALGRALAQFQATRSAP